VLKAVAVAALAVLAACSSSGDGEIGASDGKGCAALVHVFVETGATAQRERRIGQVIEGADGVVDSTFHSRREAFREFKELYEKQPDIYESKNPSEFPSRYEVTLESDDFYDLFERTLAGATTGVDRLVPGGCATAEPSP
jgi:cell division protein FtsX